MTTSTLATHDDFYYFEDGNCVVQVEDRLFNLHRFILQRNSGIFRDMFSVPRPADESAAVEGNNDEHPIVCDDSLEAFRVWCWVLYAGFEELELGIENSRSFSLEEVTHVGSLAHKYQCDRIERWALKTLKDKLEMKNAGLFRRLSLSMLGGYSMESLEYLIRTSMKCGWSLVGVSEKLLLAKIRPFRETSGDAGESSTGMVLSRILHFADSIGSAELKARAYYAFLGSCKWRMNPYVRLNRIRLLGTMGVGLDLAGLANQAVGSQMWWDTLEALTDKQKLCLYRGFQALSSLRDEMQTMPRVELQSDCDCMAVLSETWKHCAKALCSDILLGPKEFLMTMKSKLNGLWCQSPECGLVKLCGDIDRFIEWFDGNLVNFFPE